MTIETNLTALAQAIGADIKELYTRTNTFTFTQAVPSDTWSIVHNLNKHPSITVVDSAGTVVEGNVDYVTPNELVVSFAGGFSGKAYLN